MPLRLPARKAHKYHAKPVTVDGIRFASTKESWRYGELKMLETIGEIHSLRLQPVFPLVAIAEATGERGIVGLYRADFSYCTRGSAALVVEDCKGMDTPLSKWKRRHVAAQYGIQVKLT